MKPDNLKTKIFLDSGDPAETREALSILGFLDGQTTNPSLIAKNPATAGKKFTKGELLKFYRGVVEEISSLIPNGSVSIEVYADQSTSSAEMLKQGREFYKWIAPHPALSPKGRGGSGGAHIKFPITSEGMKAAEQAVKEGIRVNMTLCFSQEQAAAVYAVTRGASRGQIYVSPFVGRLDDKGERGMDLVANILRMYQEVSATSLSRHRRDISPSLGEKNKELAYGHVEVLTASVRSVDHIAEAIRLGSDIITAPLKVLKDWADTKFQISNFKFQNTALTPIPYQEISLNKPWQEYDIHHELTDIGIQKFADDWNKLIDQD